MRSRVTGSVVPAARSDGLLIEPVGDETVIYDTRSREAHCLKPLAAIVFGCSDGVASVAEIAKIAEQRLGASVSDADVADALAQLASLELLQTPLVIRAGGRLVATNGRGVSRREMLRRVGFAGAATVAGTSLVTSIVAPNAFAASGIPSGCSGCGKNTDCLSNHCCQNNSGKQCNVACCVGANNSCHLTNCICTGGQRGGLGCTDAGQPCPGGTCFCECTVCSTDIGGCPPSCPAGTIKCCTPTC